MEPACILQDLCPCIMRYIEIQVMGAYSTMCKRHKRSQGEEWAFAPLSQFPVTPLPVTTVDRFVFWYLLRDI